GSSAHPEVYEAARVLEQALHVLRIARDDYSIDALTVGQITQVLKDKFRLSVTPQGVHSASNRKGVVDRVPAGKGTWKFRLMAAGETFLADPGQAPPASTRRRATRGRARAKTAGEASEQPASEAPAKSLAPGRRASGRPGPKKMLAELMSTGYFSGPRVIGEIQAYIEQHRGYQFKATDLSPTLTRLLRDGSLKRSKREDGQYQYTTA
ncbi:MAG: hypothetical protein ACR2PL_18555, partial [Dehalococcoidia bacterium]